MRDVQFRGRIIDDDEFPCNAPTHEWAKVIGNIYDNPELLKRH